MGQITVVSVQLQPHGVDVVTVCHRYVQKLAAIRYHKRLAVGVFQLTDTRQRVEIDNLRCQSPQCKLNADKMACTCIGADFDLMKLHVWQELLSVKELIMQRHLRTSSKLACNIATVLEAALVNKGFHFLTLKESLVLTCCRGKAV